MTQPAVQGFPDWQRNTPAQNVIYATINQAFAGQTNLGPFFCGYSAATRIALTATNKNLSLLIFWFADKALTQPLGQQEVVVQTNALVDTALSNMGPWFIIEVSAQTYPATATFQASAVAYVGNGPGLAFSNILITRENSGIAIAGTLSVFTTQVYPGPAVLTINANNGPFTISLAAIDITGARVPFYQKVVPAIGFLSDAVILPAGIVRAIVTNSSGAVLTCSLFLVGDPSTRPGR